MSRSSSRGRVPNYQNETLLYNTIQDIKNMQTESYDTLKSIENYLIEQMSNITQDKLDLFTRMLEEAKPYLGDRIYEFRLYNFQKEDIEEAPPMSDYYKYIDDDHSDIDRILSPGDDAGAGGGGDGGGQGMEVDQTNVGSKRRKKSRKSKKRSKKSPRSKKSKKRSKKLKKKSKKRSRK